MVLVILSTLAQRDIGLYAPHCQGKTRRICPWFDMNLLNVGLHNYGFTSGIARNLIVFTVLELMAGFGTYYWAKSRKRSLILPVMMNETIRQQ